MKTQISALVSLGAVIAAMQPLHAHAERPAHDGHHEHSTHRDHGAATTSKSWQLEAKTALPVAKDGQTVLSVQLRDAGGQLITSTELARVHEEKLHLLVVDETLSDYHHLHPVESSPGNFAVNFAPRAGGRYLVFADVTDRATKTQRYLRADIHAGGSSPKAEHAVRHEAEVDGYRFVLSVPNGISLAKGGHAVVRVSNQHGKPVHNLEPVMGAFAHAVGFSSDLGAVLHVHPHGPEPQSNAERAGPEIGFHINPDRVGFHRLARKSAV